MNLKGLQRRTKEFTIGFIVVSVIAVFLIVVIDKASAKGCDAACRKQEFVQAHVKAFNAGGLGRTPQALYERGEMKAKIHAAWNSAARSAKTPYARAAYGIDFGHWWDDFTDTATCAVTHSTDSCIKTATGPYADAFVDVWDGAVDVTFRCAVPVAIGTAAGSVTGKPWVGAGAGAGTCFWAWYYDKTH